jgi:formate dehydrogenase major subunit
VVGAANSALVEKGLAKLEWLVVRDFALTETAEFWKGRRVAKGEVKTEDIATEVFYLPAAMPGEKEGTVTNTSRMVQWHDHVCDAPGDSRSDLWFIYHLGRKLKALYADSDNPGDLGLKHLTWDYPVRGERDEPSATAVLKEINGYTVADGKQLKAFTELKDDGSTASGCWIYTGVYPEEGKNVARSRTPDAPDNIQSHQGWSFVWPANRRTLYNRASADPDGKPWSERKKMIWWDEAQGKWTGSDVPDFPPTKRPDFRPDWTKQPHGMDAISGAAPFMMNADGMLAVFAPSGLKDGPLPTFYEPVESPSKNRMYDQQFSPTAKIWKAPGNELHAPQDPRFPHVFTTYRLTELHCAGIPTRIMPHTAELQPEAFVEISPELAAEIGVKNLDWTVLSTLRNEIEVKALVTERMRPFRIGGRTVHQIGMPWVYGWKGYAHGAAANALLAITGDANTSINVTKALTCAIRAGRLPVGQREPVDA